MLLLLLLKFFIWEIWGFGIVVNGLNDSLEFVRLNFNKSMTRYEALFKCKEEMEGSFASSYYLNDLTKKWIYDVITESVYVGLKYHRDVYNDSSYMVYYYYTDILNYILGQISILNYSFFMEKRKLT